MSENITKEMLDTAEAELFIQQSLNFALIAEGKLNELHYKTGLKINDKNIDISKEEVDFIEHLCALKFFPSENNQLLINEFINYNIIGRYFISIEKIYQEIIQINQRNVVYMHPELALKFIGMYLDLKIITNVINELGYNTTKTGNGREPINNLHAMSIKYKKSVKNKRKNNGNKYKIKKDYKVFDLIMPLAESFNKIIKNSGISLYNDLNAELIAMSSSKQNLSELLLISEKGINAPKKGKEMIALEFYNLFILLMPERFCSEKEFADSNDGSWKSYKQYFYKEFIIGDLKHPRNSSLFTSQ